MTVDPSKSTCQTRYCGRENLAPISRVRKFLPFRWGKGWVLGTKGGHVEVETSNVVVRESYVISLSSRSRAGNFASPCTGNIECGREGVVAGKERHRPVCRHGSGTAKRNIHKVRKEKECQHLPHRPNLSPAQASFPFPGSATNLLHGRQKRGTKLFCRCRNNPRWWYHPFLTSL